MRTPLLVFWKSIGLALIAPTFALAHDFTNELVTEPPQLDSMPSGSKYGVSDAVINAFKLWDSGSKIVFCFMDGSAEARRFFIESADRWDRTVDGFTFWFGASEDGEDCDGTNNSDIRVSFSQSGNWSYVGTDAVRVAANRPTLNIGSMPAAGPSGAIENSLRGTILHELGHAIGLSHEHQNPDANCAAELDWEHVYSELSKPPNRWSRDKIDRNLRPLIDNPRIRRTEYDPKSIMHYYFPGAWFADQKNATCASQRNITLSSTDIAAARYAYPTSSSDQVGYFESLIAELNREANENSLSEDDYKRLLSLVEDLLPPAAKEATSMALATGENGTAVVIGDVSVTNTGNNNTNVGVNLGTIGD